MFRKLFLVREIISRQGVVHFRRYRFLETPWLRLYLHQILESDKDSHLHDHPWGFFSLILRGGYEEQLANDDGSVSFNECLPGTFYHRKATQAHCINRVFEPTWTLVLAYGKRREWGYHTDYGWVDNQTYRNVKNAGRKDKAMR